MKIKWALRFLTVGTVLCAHGLVWSQEAESDIVQPDNGNWLEERTPLEGEQKSAATLDEAPDALIVDEQVSGALLKQSGEPLQLGFVNLRRVMASIPQLTILRARLDSEFGQQKAELDRQSEEIQKLENDLADMPRGDAYSELENQVIAKRRTFARLNASFRDAYSVRRNEELATLQQLVVDEIVNLAKDEGYDVILNDTGVIFVSPEADLTLAVVERLQQQVRQGQDVN